MFDNLTPPTNLPTAKEPEDMFEKVAPSATASSAPSVLPPPLADPTGSSAATAPAEIKSPLVSSRRVIVVGGVVLGVLVIAGVGFAAFRFVRNAASPLPVAENSAPTSTVQETAVPQIPELPSPLPLPGESVPEQEQLAPNVPVDSDGDGLTDAEEEGLGTIKENPDSDNDELLDGEEAKTYQTDPMNPDTDGDTYLDGQEVKSGYNPKGEGRIFTVPNQ